MDFLEKHYKESFIQDLEGLKISLEVIPNMELKQRILASIESNSCITLEERIHPGIMSNLRLSVDSELRFAQLRFVEFIQLVPYKLIEDSAAYCVRLSMDRILSELAKIQNSEDFFNEWLQVYNSFNKKQREAVSLGCPIFFGSRHCNLSCEDCWRKVLRETLKPYIK